MKAELRKNFRFESAHFLPNFPPDHKCRRLHGHSFILEVCVEGIVDPQTGIVMDYADIKKVVSPLVCLLDHRLINDVGDETDCDLLRNPTSENISKWFYDKIKPEIPLLTSIIIHETCTTACIYRGED